MLEQPMIEKLLSMRLQGMADALKAQEQDPGVRELSFVERLSLLVDQQWNWRENQALARRLKSAKLRHNACIEDIDYRAARGLEKTVIRGLAKDSQWVQNHENLFVLGPTGVGKSFIACALAQKACRDGYSAFYTRAAALFRDLALARADGSFRNLLGATEPDRRAGDRRLGHGAAVRTRAPGLLGDLRGPLSGPFADSHVAVAGDPLARTDRRSDRGRWHPRPTGSQRSSHRDARRFDAQESRKTQRVTDASPCVYSGQARDRLLQPSARSTCLSKSASDPARKSMQWRFKSNRRCRKPSSGSFENPGYSLPHRRPKTDSM